MPGSWAHLAARFVDVVSSVALDPVERRTVEGWLRPGEDALFFSQSVADQRHGHTAALRIEQRAPDRLDLIRAALLHDVGKRHARLGPVGRVAASLAVRLHFPVRGRFLAYRDHGRLGAAELRDLGAEPTVVEFAEAHHEARPDAFDPTDWEALEEADAARLPRSRRSGGYAGPGMRTDER
jgi:putative nucleotidyltransferase with HDIG domain